MVFPSLITGALAAGGAAGATIHVPADQPTIGAAMVAAAPGDEIVVAPGTYSDGAQPLISSGFSGGKDLIIRSSGGPEVTILDGLGTIRLVELYQQESNAFVIEGFTLRNGVFASNWGGAMLLWDAAPTVRDCVFEFNDAHHGGAAATYYSVGAVFENCVFRNNTARIGGGVANFYSEPRYVDCVFEGNVADDPTLYNEGGGAWDGGGVGRYEGCVFRNNIAETGGGLFAKGATTAVDLIDCVVEGNSATTSHGGGVCAVGSTVVRAVNTRFLGNETGSWGGGVFVQQSPETSFINCEFSGNRTNRWTGAGVYASLDTVIEVRNCTFAGNAALSTTGGGFQSSQNCVVTIANSVFWGNTTFSGTTAPRTDEIAQVQVSSPASFTIDFSVVQGLDALIGTALMDVDPLLVDALGADGVAGTMDDDLRLSSASPAIDAGDNGMVGVDAFDLDGDGDFVEVVPFDLAGGARFIDDVATADTGVGAAPIVDLGAYEAASGAPACPADLDGSGSVDGADLGLLLGNWGAGGATDLSGDGTTDGADLGLLLGAWGGCG
jgi:hypothetical protein